MLLASANRISYIGIEAKTFLPSSRNSSTRSIHAIAQVQVFFEVVVPTGSICFWDIRVVCWWYIIFWDWYDIYIYCFECLLNCPLSNPLSQIQVSAGVAGGLSHCDVGWQLGTQVVTPQMFRRSTQGVVIFRLKSRLVMYPQSWLTQSSSQQGRVPLRGWLKPCCIRVFPKRPRSKLGYLRLASWNVSMIFIMFLIQHKSFQEPSTLGKHRLTQPQCFMLKMRPSIPQKFEQWLNISLLDPNSNLRCLAHITVIA